ncbi:putative flavin-binding monooxygenase-like protein [Botrytis cinerea BcDW1]|uniref:Putative flavin-binding monooxygenase-like protein n=1 Tax=Botryotinia fuckeliana (strain BcDW1) TaxID=1290391 RepID=M7UQR5_BOTF1|nr:putative flavin-binding monooxygenase-like protein [Botrytis cinerea BcDW1]
MSGFSDVPLTVPEDAPLYHDTFEAKYVTNYLEEYAHNHIYNGKTMFSRIKFYCKAVKTNKVNDKWLVTTELPIYLKQKRPSQPPIVYTCRKLVVATGRTSHPKIPSIDWEPSMRFVRHQKAFGELSQQPLPWASGILFFAVLGGGKSAADMVYELVKKGQNVKWIIRASGEGPALLFPAPGHGRYKNSVESSATRLKALFSPSPFMPNTWWSSMIRILLYGTRIGISYMIRRIRNVDQYCRNIAGYDSRPGSLSGFKFLDFSSSAFWCTGPVGLVQHDDFWETISQNVQVYRNDVVSYQNNIITLDNGKQLIADELLLGTGWDPRQQCFSDIQAQYLGLPHFEPMDSVEERSLWEKLYEEADRRVIAKFPLLGNPPPHQNRASPDTTVQRLYKGIAPLGDNSIAFLGAIDISNSFRAAETQAIWTTAYFDGNIKLPPLEQMVKEVAYMGAFSKRRYPTHGQKGECFFFELIWYTDALLHEVGLRSHRKGWWADLVEPCLASDLKDIKDEYKQKFVL